ncbi:MAG: ribose-phosphate diphosphokinase [bacterium]
MIVVHNNTKKKYSELAENIAQRLTAPIIKIPLQHFVDNETYVSSFDIQKIAGQKLFLIHQFFHTTCEEFTPINAQIFDFLFIAHLLKACKASAITTLLPYLPYSRQDKSDIKEIKGALHFIGKTFACQGIHDIICTDLHSSHAKGLMGGSLHSIGLEEFWAEHIKENILPEHTNICLASPDLGGKARIEKIAKILGLEFISMEKTRIGPDESIPLPLSHNVEGKTIIIVDDILDTGKTALNACALLIKHGATEVFGCFSHAVFSFEAQSLIEKSPFSKIYLTDTILFDDSLLSKKFQKVSINTFLSKKISGLLS